MVVGPDLDLLWAGLVVVGSKDSRGRAYFVHQRDREKGVGLGAGGEVDAIEVGKGTENGLYFVTMSVEKLDNLLIRVAIGNLGSAFIMAEERHIGHGYLKVGDQARYCQRDAAALAAAADGDALGINGGIRPDRLDGAHGVGEDTALVVRSRVQDASRHESG